MVKQEGYALVLRITTYIEQQLEELRKTVNVRITYASRPEIRSLNLNPAIIVDLNSSTLMGEIGVWSGKTSDISVWSTSGDSIFEFHDYFDGFEDITAKIDEALQLYRAMDAATTLVESVRKVIRSYATHGYSSGKPFRLYYIENEKEQVFSIVALYDPIYKRPDLVLMARIVNNQVIIDIDKTSVPLYDELKRVGIPETQITLAWHSK